MKCEHVIEVLIPSELGYEKVAISVMACLAHLQGFGDRRIDDLKTALGEAVINAIEHGNQLNNQLTVHVIAQIEDRSLILKVIDEGQKPLPKLTSTRQDRADHRGWGLFLIQRLVDEVTTVVAPNRNELQMVMYLN
jgi:serine/threonine-protein kinase RsbW